jgi:long-chain fatty acid transport protein
MDRTLLPGRTSGAMLLAAALLTCSARQAAANPPDTYGIGARSTALGGAVTAGATDFSAGYYNPAGLARSSGTELSLGYKFAAHRLKLGGQDSRLDPVRALVGGVVARGAVADVPVAVGVTAQIATERLSRIRTRRAEEPRWLLYDDRPHLLYLSLSAAVRPFAWASLGAGIAMLSSTQGSFTVTGTVVQPDDGGASQNDSQLRHEVDVDLTSRRYPLLGVALMPADELSVAVVYRGQATVAFDMAGQLQGDVQTAAFTVPAAYEVLSRSTSEFVPRQVAVGVHAEPLSRLSLELDVVYVNWGAYQSPFSRTDSQLTFEAPADLLGLPADTGTSPPPDPQFEDRLVPRIGVEYVAQPAQVLAVPIRLGYAFEKSPVPAQTGRSNLVDNDRHVVALGSGFVWQDPARWLPGELRFDLFGQWTRLPTRVTLKASPADFVGDYRAEGDIFAVGADVSLGFR